MCIYLNIHTWGAICQHCISYLKCWYSQWVTPGYVHEANLI